MKLPLAQMDQLLPCNQHHSDQLLLLRQLLQWDL